MRGYDMQPFGRADAARIVRELVRTGRDAALGTLSPEGTPFVSHVAVATLCNGAPVLLISDLAVHTQNLKRDARASLLFAAAADADSRDPNTRPRVTLTGKVTPAANPDEARARMLQRHPDAAGYIDFTDFHLMTMAVTSSYLVAGFGRIVDLEPAEYLPTEDAAASMATMDAEAIAHMNEDHLDALEAMATGLAGAPAGPWTALSLDPHGLDLGLDHRCVRVEFDSPISGPGPLRMALKTLTDRARQALVQNGQNQ
ncbi:MAG: DUF2470 domain-containing protein [Pseudomonadota bacterium]